MRWVCAVVLCATLLGAACTDDPEFVSAVYGTCFDIDDCTLAATRCEELIVDFAGAEFENAICTVGCRELGARSADCPRGVVTTRFGSCYPSDAAGGETDMPVCFEPCDRDLDCLVGFRCLSDIDLCPAEGECDIDPGDSICVPGPS